MLLAPQPMGFQNQPLKHNAVLKRPKVHNKLDMLNRNSSNNVLPPGSNVIPDSQSRPNMIQVRNSMYFPFLSKILLNSKLTITNRRRQSTKNYE